MVGSDLFLTTEMLKRLLRINHHSVKTNLYTQDTKMFHLVNIYMQMV